MSKVSENIKKYRLQMGLKQAELGKMLGKAPSVIANWEAETNRPDVDSIERMLAIFNVDANTFFSWEGKLSPDHPRIGGLDDNGIYVDDFTKEDSLEIIRDMAKLPTEALGELKTVFEFLDFKYNRKG